MNIRIPYLLAALIAVAAVMNTNTEKGVSAATSLVMESISGKKFEINKPASSVLLVSFWSPNCSICARDVPVLQNLHSQFERTDLEILAVAMQYDDVQEVKDFAETQSINYPVAVDESGKIAAAFPGVRFTPTSFLLDGDGTIIWRHTGKLDSAEVKNTVRQALASIQLAAARSAVALR